MGALLPHLPLPLTHRLSRDLRCPPLLSLYGRLGKQQPLGARMRRSCLLASWSLPRSRCASAHLLSKAHTWANQSQIIGEQLPSQSSLPKLAKQTHCLFLGVTHTLASVQRTTREPLLQAQPPPPAAWSSSCAQLWLLTARSAAAAPRCQDLFRERAGGAKTRWAEEEEEEEGAHILEHRGNQAHLSIRLSPTALCIPASQMFNQSKCSLHLLTLLDTREVDLAPSRAKVYTRKKNSMDRNLKDIRSSSSFNF